MVRKTVHIPDDLNERVKNVAGLEDSYSGVVQDALREYCERREAVTEA